jgi:hypothetical protein
MPAGSGRGKSADSTFPSEMPILTKFSLVNPRAEFFIILAV